MGDVVDIRGKKPHLAGDVICLACKHEWAGVAEPGTIDLECPSCGCPRGVWRNPMAPEEGSKIWACYACDNALYFLQVGERTKESYPTVLTVCAGCGQKGNLLELYENI